MTQPNYHDFYVTFPIGSLKQNGYTKIIAENLDEAALVIADKCGLNFLRVYVPGEWNSDYEYLRGIYPDGQTETYAVINHNGKRFVMNNAPLENLSIESSDETISTEIQIKAGHSKNDVFWIYELSGQHDGEIIKIAVKNVQKDFDSYGVCATDEGKFWADDLTPLDDYVTEWYDDLNKIVEREYFESCD